MAVPVGTTVVASNDGVVAFSGAVAFELFVSIDHADGIRTTYSFLSAVSVTEGDVVGRGQPIAASGPGHAGTTNPHLHFGAKIGEQYIDPEPLLLDGLRRNVSQAIRLVPAEPSGEPTPAGGSIAALPALGGTGIAWHALGRRRARGLGVNHEEAARETDRHLRRKRTRGG